MKGFVCIWVCECVCVHLQASTWQQRSVWETSQLLPVRGRRSGMVKCWWGWSSFTKSFTSCHTVLFPLTSQCEGALLHKVHRLAVNTGTTRRSAFSFTGFWSIFSASLIVSELQAFTHLLTQCCGLLSQTFCAVWFEPKWDIIKERHSKILIWRCGM